MARLSNRQPPTVRQVRDALGEVASWIADPAAAAPPRPALADAVRASARYLAARHPGGAVELRIPPFVAVQCVAGATHRRGTPPNVVEMSPRTWLELATGRLGWDEAMTAGQVSASGSRADLGDLLPLLAAHDQLEEQ